MAELDEFRKQLLAGLAQQTLAAKSAHETMTPPWLKPYQVPEIPPGMVAGKIGPGEMNVFERMFGAAMDLAPTPVKAAPAMAAAGMGMRITPEMVARILGQASKDIASGKPLKTTTEHFAYVYPEISESVKPVAVTKSPFQKLAEIKALSEKPTNDPELDRLLAELSAPNPAIAKPESTERILRTLPGAYDPEDPAAKALKAIQEILGASEHAYDIEKKIASGKVTLPEWRDPLEAQWTQPQFRKAAEQVKGMQLPQWPAPEHAKAAGFNYPAAHATIAEHIIDPITGGSVSGHFSRFIPGTGTMQEIGAHFGTPKAAADRIAAIAWSKSEPRIYPTVLRIKNPLDLHDFGSWGPPEMREGMKASGKFDPAEISRLSRENMQEYRDLIASRGFDAIRYINRMEDPGSISYAMFKTDPTGHLTGIRSPFAKFKDLESSDISAVLAGLGLTGTGATIALKRDVENRLEQ